MPVRQTQSMLDLVRRTGGQGRSVQTDYDEELNAIPPVFEVDFGEDEAQAEHLKPPEPYGGQFRFCSLNPEEVRRRLASNTNPADQEALEVAEGYWRGAGAYAANPEDLGHVYRGEPREAIQALSMAELAASVSPVAAIIPGASLRAGGIPSVGDPVGPGDYRDSGIVDWDLLLGMGPLPQTEDWF